MEALAPKAPPGCGCGRGTAFPAVLAEPALGGDRCDLEHGGWGKVDRGGIFKPQENVSLRLLLGLGLGWEQGGRN